MFSDKTFILVDLEATCWDTEPLASVQEEECEIIEIGAVKVALTRARRPRSSMSGGASSSPSAIRSSPPSARR